MTPFWSESGYLWEAKQRNLPVIFANEGVDATADHIWRIVSGELAVRDSSKPAPVAPPVSIKEVIDQKKAANEGPLVEKDKDGNYSVTEAGQAYLANAVTDVDGNVYAFTDKLSPITVAAAMARLSRRGDDMRVTILDEFANKVDKDAQLLHRVITAYGDDSVQQLGGIHFVVESASNLLTKKLEWGRLAAYLEQSTRYIYFDQKDVNGKYRYHTPEHLKPAVKQKYETAMDQLFDLYSDMVHKLTDYVRNNSDTPEKERDIAWKGAIRAQACDAIRDVLPVATKSTVGIFASGQALESLIMHLQADELPEAQIVGRQLLEQGRKVIPTFLERADKPERGGAMIAYRANTAKSVQKLAKDYLPDSHATAATEAVTLVDFWPKNELLLVPDMLYEHSNLSLEQLQSEVNIWSYDKKMEVFKAYMGERLNRRHRPGRALEKAHYSWDLVCDYGIFRDLQRHRMVDDMNWQLLTPRYGYDVPKLVEEAGLTDQFEACFDISLKLYSLLQQEGYALEAQYATLLGHKMRWKVTYNAREAFHLHELRTAPQGHPGYRKLVLQMHEKLAEVHPQLAEAMKFVNQDEDPKLTRLAAERYTQFKLQQLS
jgi:thymidylate synthase ThyX